MTDSPFLPNTQVQFAWDSTSIGLFKTCPRLYKYVMIDGYQTNDESIHLRFGIEVHAALQDYDKLRAKGASFDEALHNTISALVERCRDWRPDRNSRAGKYKNEASVVRTIIDYLDHYHEDPATTVILHNGEPAVELSFSFELSYGPTADQPYLLCGHLDRVVNFAGDRYVMDRKTTTSTPGPYYFNQYNPNNQMTLYTFGGSVVMDTMPRGVIIDAIQVLTASTNFQRGFTYRTPDQIQEWQTDLRVNFQMAAAFAEADMWPMNDTACDKFGGCKFREVCASSPNVRDVYLKNFRKLAPEDRWNPLKPR